MIKTLIVFERGPAIDEPEYQEVWDPDKKISIFNVGNLGKCPEDAIIGRALHNAYDAKVLIEFGIQYAKEGYGSIKLIHEFCPNDEDLGEFIDDYLNNWKS